VNALSLLRFGDIPEAATLLGTPFNIMFLWSLYNNIIIMGNYDHVIAEAKGNSQLTVILFLRFFFLLFSLYTLGP